MWVHKNKAVILTGKSITTIHRWMKSNEDNRSRINESGEINLNELEKDYPLLACEQIGSSEFSNVDALELANEQTQLKTFDNQLNSSHEIINKLIDRKSRIPIWLNIGYISLILTSIAFGKLYMDKMSNIHFKELERLQETSDIESNLKLNNARLQIQHLESINKKQEQEIEELKKELPNNAQKPLFELY